MHIGLDTGNICSGHVHLVEGQAFLLAFLPTNCHDGVHIFSFIELRHCTRVENTIDVFEHLLIYDLGINEEERSNLAFCTSLHQALFEIVTPVLHIITFDDLNLIEFVITHEGCEFCETLSTTTAYAEQKSVTRGVSENTANSTDMVTCINEHDQLHWVL